MSKYRIWNDIDEEYVYIEMSDIKNLVKELNKFYPKPRNETKTFKRIKRKFPKDYLEENPHYVQEFSGFTDLSGKDIYEGDKITKNTLPYFDGKELKYVAKVVREKGVFIYILESAKKDKKAYLNGIQYNMSRFGSYTLI